MEFAMSLKSSRLVRFLPGADSSTWRERLPYKQEVAGSNPVPPRPSSRSARSGPERGGNAAESKGSGQRSREKRGEGPLSEAVKPPSRREALLPVSETTGFFRRSIAPAGKVVLAGALAVTLGSCAAGGPGGASPHRGLEVSEVKQEGVQVVVIKTTRGTIKFALFEQYAPKTVENFVTLAEEGYFDGLVFHRVLPGVLIQGGDPKGDGTGGPGYTIKAEFNERSHTVGAVAMARARDPDSAGSQFYICVQSRPDLDRRYTVFGQVYEGMDVVGSVQKGDRMTEVRIERVPEVKLPAGALK